MLRNFLKNRKAQNTAEYALLIALVVAGVIAMQTYAQRALQARIHDASQFLANQTSGPSADNIPSTTQYEPYYLVSNYDVHTNSIDSKRLTKGTDAYDMTTNRLRSGAQTEAYNATSDIGKTQ